MSKGEVKNPQTDQRVGNKSGQQGRNPGDSSQSRSSQRDMDRR